MSGHGFYRGALVNTIPSANTGCGNWPAPAGHNLCAANTRACITRRINS